MRCTHCKKEINDNEFSNTTVYSAGDYDPYCNTSCQNAAREKMNREMTAISGMNDQEFYGYMGVPHLSPKPAVKENDNPNWKEDGF
jgi:hypothetical protein